MCGVEGGWRRGASLPETGIIRSTGGPGRRDQGCHWSEWHATQVAATSGAINEMAHDAVGEEEYDPENTKSIEVAESQA